ncbi:uncharacterized protein LOC132735021 isoform X2 [Ruditapes philippinarum]|uniref:uncharacterized protein LOC132735021 isoform X2 n=1 Tax=Ruditapes philippinarum TaxID=129788 RepID=UPI00295BC4AD|nr:uncharacterized protein LOC132735021 isoform X2 [Ruditapes philippinarum]
MQKEKGIQMLFRSMIMHTFEKQEVELCLEHLKDIQMHFRSMLMHTFEKQDVATLLGTSEGYSDAFPVNVNAYIRKTRRGTLLGTSEDKSTIRKCMKNKAEFQRLLGEMIGMYRRSKLPENLKPQLNGPPEGEVMMKLYKISPSIRGYSYKFITRLQIHVLSDDIERLKQEIAEELEKHGFISDSYDIVPPLDDVRPFIKILAGSKVCNTVQNEAAVFGTLTGFVKMESYEQKETICCSLASKHLLDGQKTIQISNREQTMTAAVIKETAPGDSNMYVDIAAAIINKEDEKYCDGRFKTEDGKLIKGIMFTKDDSLLACQHVHINGASTSLGLGIIATTHCNNRESIETRNGQKQSCERKEEIEKANEDDKFIYVESRKKSSPFCTGGDSGAMVCADDDDGNHVELISTVIGKVVNQRETEQCGAENVKVKDNVVYQTLRLETGVTHLKKLIKSEIDFFES